MNKVILMFICALSYLSGFNQALAENNSVDWDLPLAFQGIFILGPDNIENPRAENSLLTQCARQPISAQMIWRPTFQQVKFIDVRLRDHLKKTQSPFKVLPHNLYHRQYAGYTDESGEWIYINVYPVKKSYSTIESRKPVVSCEKSRLYWGISFSIESFQFSEIRYNNQTILPIKIRVPEN